MLIPAGPDALLTGTQCAHIAGVSLQAIANWHTRGHLPAAGLDRHGRKLYRKTDLWAAMARPTAPRRTAA